MTLSEELREWASQQGPYVQGMQCRDASDLAIIAAELERKLAAWEALATHCRNEGLAIAFPGPVDFATCADWSQQEDNATSPRLLCVNLGIDGFGRHA